MPRWASFSGSRTLGPSVAIALLGALLWLDVPLCPSASVFGLPCPGCGLTRATWALLGGDLAHAVRLHPLVLLAMPALSALTALGALSVFSVSRPMYRTISERWLMSRASSVLGATALALLLLVWALRFFGWFGGPVPVETLTDWWRERVATG